MRYSRGLSILRTALGIPGVDKCLVRKLAKESVLSATTISVKEACSFPLHLRSAGAGFLRMHWCHRTISEYISNPAGTVRRTAFVFRFSASPNPKYCLLSRKVTSIGHRHENQRRITVASAATSVLSKTSRPRPPRWCSIATTLTASLVRLSQLCSECDEVFQWLEYFMNRPWNPGG